MKKLIFILLAIIALFTFIQAFGYTLEGEKTDVSAENIVEIVQ